MESKPKSEKVTHPSVGHTDLPSKWHAGRRAPQLPLHSPELITLDPAPSLLL